MRAFLFFANGTVDELPARTEIVDIDKGKYLMIDGVKVVNIGRDKMIQRPKPHIFCFYECYVMDEALPFLLKTTELPDSFSKRLLRVEFLANE